MDDKIEKVKKVCRINPKVDFAFEGLKEGLQKKAIEIAKNLLDVLDNETIALKTGLSLEDIEKLRQ
jgi:hypothetical protein